MLAVVELASLVAVEVVVDVEAVVLVMFGLSLAVWLWLPACEVKSLVASEVPRRELAVSVLFDEIFSVVEAALVSDRPTVLEEWVSTKSAVVSTVAVVTVVVSRFVGLSVVTSSAKTGLAIKAKLAKAVAQDRETRRFLDVNLKKLEFTFITFLLFLTIIINVIIF